MYVYTLDIHAGTMGKKRMKVNYNQTKDQTIHQTI